jgi:hypothetical protein
MSAKAARAVLLVAAAAAALVPPASASPAKTIRLSWSERATVGRRASAGKGWSGRLSGLGATALARKSVRVRFIYFEGRALPRRPGFGWISDHVVLVG